MQDENFFTDSNEEAIEEHIKDHKELIDKTYNLLKNKARKDSQWETFAVEHKLSGQVCKT